MRIQGYTVILLLLPLFSVYAQNGYTFEFNTKTEPIDDGAIKQTEIGMQFLKNFRTANQWTNTTTYKSTVITDEAQSPVLTNFGSHNSTIHFYSFSSAFEFLHQFSQKTKLILNFEPTVNFQNTMTISDISILGGVTFNQIINNHYSIAVGIKRMNVFGKPQMLPILAFNHEFTEKIKLKLGFPDTVLSYSGTLRDRISLTNDFSGSSYNLNPSITADKKNSINKTGISQIETAFQYERNMESSWFVNFKGGYSTSRKFKFIDTNNSTEISQPIKNGSVFSISIKYKLK